MYETADNGQHVASWVVALDELLRRLEEAEAGLAHTGAGRRDSGSYYTPADVAAHFWQLFWRHHEVTDGPGALSFLAANTFVEPSAGSGMFVFSLLRSLAGFGLGPAEVAGLKLIAVDINKEALTHLEGELREVEARFGVRFANVSLENRDFLRWAEGERAGAVTFVGNPPFVANERGSRWKNLYADFLEAMLASGQRANVSLILPVSVCFSRDYVGVRRLLKETCAPLSASSYDNMPDYLFKAGKPESGNTNKANSQRCTILNLGGAREGVIESSALLRWSSSERTIFLSSTPEFYDCSGFDIERQIPRPCDASLTNYLDLAKDRRTVRQFMSRIGHSAFAVGGVARNFIGIRDYDAPATGVTPIRANEKDSSLILLQVLASRMFYRYWRSFGDGFHVTSDLIDRFPISDDMLRHCEVNVDHASLVWREREKFAKVKLNSGKQVRSYDFSTAFSKI